MIPVFLPAILFVQTSAPLPPVPVLKQAKKLGLSVEQVKQLEQIQLKYAKELTEKRKALIDSSVSFHNEVQAVLTSEQKVKAKKLKIQ